MKQTRLMLAARVYHHLVVSNPYPVPFPFPSRLLLLSLPRTDSMYTAVIGMFIFVLFRSWIEVPSASCNVSFMWRFGMQTNELIKGSSEDVTVECSPGDCSFWSSRDEGRSQPIKRRTYPPMFDCVHYPLLV